MREAEPTYDREDIALMRRIARHDGAYVLRGGERPRGRKLATKQYGVLAVRTIARAKGRPDLHATLTDAGRWMLQRIDRRGAA